MKSLDAKERHELVELFRELSPRELALEVPILRPDLEALVGKPLPRRPRAILFDVYGTLLISEAGGEPALDGAGKAKTKEGRKARALLEESLSKVDYECGARAFTRDVALLIKQARADSITRTQFPEIDMEFLVALLFPKQAPEGARRLALLLEACNNPCSSMPGAKTLLSRLALASFRLGVVSNAQFYTPLLIEALLGAAPSDLGFEEGLSAYSFELGIAKPDTAPFSRAAAGLLAEGMQADEILVVGNSSADDIAPARKLGFMTALFAGDARSYRHFAPGTPGACPDSVLRGYDAFERIFPR